MTTRTLLRLAAATLAVSALTAACGDDDDGSPPVAAQPAQPSQPAPPRAAVEITSPVDGASVTSPVKVTMAATNFVVEPAGSVREGAGHFHVMVDTACVAKGTPIPLETKGYNHFGKAQLEANLDLPPGTHTLCLQAGDGAHLALDLTDSVTVTVAG